MGSIYVGTLRLDKISGFLEIGTNDHGEVVINHGDLKPDENGVGHIVFSPNQARQLATLLIKHASEAEEMFNGGTQIKYTEKIELRKTSIRAGKAGTWKRLNELTSFLKASTVKPRNLECQNCRTKWKHSDVSIGADLDKMSCSNCYSSRVEITTVEVTYRH